MKNLDFIWLLSHKNFVFSARFSDFSHRGGNLPPVESATPFSLTLPHNVRNIIAAKPRANSYLHASFTAFAASLYSSRIFLKAASQFSLKLFSSRDV